MNDDFLRSELDRVVAGAPPVGFTAADVLRDGRKRRRVRRGAAATAGVAALALVVAVPAAVLRDGAAPGGIVAGGSPQAPVTPAPTPAPATGSPAPGDGTRALGLSADEARRIVAACAGQAGLAGTELASLRLRNVVRDKAAVTISIYGPGNYLACSAPDLAGIGTASMMRIPGPGAAEWMPGPVTIDDVTAFENPPGAPMTPEYQILAGRVVDTVTVVEVTFGEARTRAPVRNGTYLVHLTPPPARAQQDVPTLVVVGYDADGRIIGSQKDHTRGCFTDPEGTVVIGKREEGGCRPATRWLPAR
jgi:hypothetical protein